ncbi:MAG: hypothetical protein FWB77_01285 [Treponema sp.]|nr:hypothetical protein [Treponema sp.]
MNRIKNTYGLLSILSFIFGIVIYITFRDLKDILLFSWIPKPGFLETILVPLKPSIFANILRFNIPDMLWFLSAILFLRFFWFFKIKEQIIYISIFYAIGFIFEITQNFDKVPGTFDWLDLFFLGIGAFVESLLYNNFILRRFL